VNTFLPFPDFEASAACLDSKRLHNQLNECKVIRAALRGAKAWNRHPATLMWHGCVSALEAYMSCLADEMQSRHMPVPDWAPARYILFDPMPVWFGNPIVHESHQRNLLRKNAAHYTPLLTNGLSPSDVYAWPTQVSPGVWIIRFKQVGAKKYEERTISC